jgi:pyruvate ferredoxin oxidoreductase beta subunit/2-oxoisovalerate ferredoxin oxidoreductase beta subunit
VKTALELPGTRFLLMHSPCPTGWKAEPADSIELVRLAVSSGLFPLYEVWDGQTYRLNVEPEGTDPGEYYRRQKRFAPDEVDLEQTRRQCAEQLDRLRLLAGLPASSSR